MLKRDQKFISRTDMKQPFLLLSVLLLSLAALAQRPFISGLDKLTGTVNEEVTISGLNLPTGGNLVVKFGAAVVQAADVVSASASLIVVKVPAGASYGPVSVTNKVNGLTGYSSDHLLLSYSGTTFDPMQLGAQQVFQTGVSPQPFDITPNDFNSDGWVDIIMTNENGNKADVYTNDRSAAISFTQTALVTNAPTRNVDSGDLDGDGLPDLALTIGNNGNRLLIYRNTSGADITFDTPPVIIILPGIGENIRIIRRPVISDLDGDGKPEIIVSNESDNTIHVYVNQSTGPGNISFASTPVELIATGATVGISGLDVKDLNNDGFPEVVANPFVSSPNLFVFRNTSTPGSISIRAATVITAPSGMVNSVVGDFDGDGFNDIATTKTNFPREGAVLLFRNATAQSGGDISIEAPVEVATSTVAPLGLGLGDLNGDGKLDIAVGSEDAFPDASIVNLINTSVGSTLTFSLVKVTSVNTSRNLKIVDVSNDGRPDIVYTNNITTDAPGDLSVFKNNNCVTPVISPVGPLTVCTNAVIVLEATLTASPMTYQWLDGGVDIGGQMNPTFTIPTMAVGSKEYSVRVTDGALALCSNTSSVVTVVVDAATTLPPDITGNTTVCVGDDFQLTTSTPAQGYQWSGPGGFTSTEQNPTITGFQPEQAGTYSLQVEIAPGGCLSNISTTDITVQNLPQPLAVNTGDTNFCVGNTVNLTTPDYMGFTYSWNKDGVPIAGETTTTLPVTAGGSYTSLITDPGTTCTLESPAETLVAVAPPVSSYTSVDAICVDLPVNFAATSTGVAGFTLAYSWAFGDAAATMAVIADPEFTYTSAGSFNAALTTSYAEVLDCANVSQKAIIVQAVPAIAIEARDEAGTVLSAPFEKCPSDEVSLIAPSTFTNVSWTNTGGTNSLGTETTFTTATAGTYTFTGTDAVGCVPVVEVSLNNFEGSGLTLSSSSTIDIDDVITLEENQERVDLSVTGGMDYSWEPAALFTDSTAAMVEISPFDINTVLTVTGTDINDCVETATVTIIDPFIAPRRAFSPNGDDLDDCWKIGNSRDLNGCTVIIFDSRGRRLLEAVSPFVEDCIWDGNFRGNLVPEGVYYYAISCDDNQFNRSGSILLAR